MRHTRSGIRGLNLEARSRQRIHKAMKFLTSGTHFAFNETPQLKFVSNLEEDYDVLVM